MSAELLARLNPKVTSYRPGGGIPELTPQDIAAGLAGAHPNVQRTALAAFARFHEPLLPGLVEARLRRLAKAEGWRASDERLQRIAKIAVWEYCDPPMCEGCEGRAIIYEPQPVQCLACNGIGYGRLQAAQICDAIGVSLREWKATWRCRYDRAYGIVAGWGSEALSHLAKRLSRDD